MMRLGSTETGKIFLAPLSGVADSPFRRICKRFGAHVVYSEMTSCEGLTRGNERSLEGLRFTEEERPIGIQIFGSDIDRMAASAGIVEELKPDFIDINLACPARKIVSKGAGCALMREPARIGKIASAVVRATRLPVTAKIRIGWDETSMNGPEVGRILEDSGITAVAVHGRTGRQVFRGRSSWAEVARVKAVVGIPVILSGDVTTPQEAERAFSETACDAVMIGRGVYGRPWVFRAVDDHFQGREFREPSSPDKVDVILKHLDMGTAEYGERVAVVRFRKHLLWYTKGIPGVVALRPAMSTVTSRQDVVALLREIFTDYGHPGVQDGQERDQEDT